MNKHSIVNQKCPCFLFRYPKLDIPSQALFNLHRTSALPLGCLVNTTKIFKALEATCHTVPIHYSPSLTGWRAKSAPQDFQVGTIDDSNKYQHNNDIAKMNNLSMCAFL